MIDWEYIKSMFNFSDESSRDEYEKLIPAAVDKVQKDSGDRCFELKDYDERLTGYGRKLRLPQYPVESLELMVDTTRTFDSDSIIPPSMYKLDKGSGIIELYDYEFPKSIDSVRVIYSAGYSLVPEDLKEAVLEVVKWLHNRLKNFGSNIGKRDFGAEGMTCTTEMVPPLHYKETIEKYRERVT